MSKVAIMNKYKGFTLIELMITVAIMSIMLTVGLPSFQSIIASSRLTSSANAMVSALQLARSEALKQHKTVIIAPKKDKAWSAGWDIFVDLNKDDIPQSGEQVLASAVFDAANSTMAITATYSDHIGYSANGRPVHNGTQANSNTWFLFCTPKSSPTDFRKVVISLTGRVHVETLTSCS